MSNKIKSYFRTWKLTATPRTVTGQKDNFTFKITHLHDFEAALRAGKCEVDRREGAETWDPNYTNQALQGERNEHL